MRKHFLILMLMALLPFTAWATVDIKDATVAAGDVTYGTTTPQSLTVNYNGPLNINEHFTVDANFYKDEACTIVAKDGEGNPYDLQHLPVGTYYLQITGIPANGFTGTRANGFKVNPAQISVTFTDTYKATLTKKYGQADPAQPTIPAVVENTLNMHDFVVNGLVAGDKVLDVLDFGTTGVHYQHSGVNASDTPYPVEITNVSLKGQQPNYELTLAKDVKITIGKVNFSDDVPAGMALAFARSGAASKPYIGAAQSTDYTVTYNLATAATPTALTANDFEVQFTPKEGDADYSATKKYVGTYKVKFIGSGTNFEGYKEFDGADYLFSITKAEGLQVRVNVVSKTYDGTAFNANQARYTFYGLQDEDEINIVDNVTGSDDFAAGVGGYNVKATLTNATIGTGAGAPKVLDNYATDETTTPVTVWTIIKRKANITVNTGVNDGFVEQINYDDELPTVVGKELATEAVASNRGVIADDIDNVKSGYTIGVVDPFEKKVGTWDYFTVTRNAANVPVLANYDITPVAGKLKINAVTLTIQPVITDMTYGDALNPAISVYYGTLPLELKEGATPEYLYSTDNITFDTPVANVKNAGTYYVKVNWESIKDYAPDGYTIDATTSCVPAVFTINPKTLKPIVDNQILHKGDALAKIQTGGSVTYAAGYGPAYEESPAYIYSITADRVVIEEDAQEVERISDWKTGVVPEDNKVAHILEVVLNGAAQYATLNGNYTIAPDYTKGDLTLLSTYLLDLANATDMAAEIQDAAANSNNYTVNFPARALKAGEWYPMVLPFTVTTVDLVNALRTSGNAKVFAVVNLLDKSSTASNVKFKLQMKQIPANEPFLIKVAEDIDLADAQFDATKIDYKAEAKVGGDAYAGNFFIGVYADTDINLVSGEKMVGFMGHVGETFNEHELINKWYSSETAKTIKPLEAYLQYATTYTKGQQAPMVTVEDYENGVTSIKSLSADEINGMNTSNGWYTLNGVQLQSAPTQKGIYINNGKKVVIK